MINLKRDHIQRVLIFLLILLLTLTPAAAANQTVEFNFASPVQLAATEAPGKWYVDRYPPCQFASPATSPDGDQQTLEESICAADSQATVLKLIVRRSITRKVASTICQPGPFPYRSASMYPTHGKQ